MNDVSPEASPDKKPAEADSTIPLPPQPLGLKFYLALALVGLLVLLILFINIPGIRAYAGISMTRANWTLQSYADSTGVVTVGVGVAVHVGVAVIVSVGGLHWRKATS